MSVERKTTNADSTLRFVSNIRLGESSVIWDDGPTHPDTSSALLETTGSSARARWSRLRASRLGTSRARGRRRGASLADIVISLQRRLVSALPILQVAEYVLSQCIPSKSCTESCTESLLKIAQS